MLAKRFIILLVCCLNIMRVKLTFLDVSIWIKFRRALKNEGILFAFLFVFLFQPKCIYTKLLSLFLTLFRKITRLFLFSRNSRSIIRSCGSIRHNGFSLFHLVDRLGLNLLNNSQLLNFYCIEHRLSDRVASFRQFRYPSWRFNSLITMNNL